MKLNNQIVCFCSSRNTSFYMKKKKKTKILKQKETRCFTYTRLCTYYIGQTANTHPTYP